MPISPLPFVDDIPVSDLRAVRAVLTDIDDTLTIQGLLPASAYEALEKLRAAGLLVIPVTGRPAGWCDHIARMWPVDGVVGENGAFYFCYDHRARRMRKIYAQDEGPRNASKDKLWEVARQAMARHPGTAVASDQAYREVDVAIDFCEDVPPLPDSVAHDIVRMFNAAGANAKASSIHVNAWFGDHNKLTTSLRFLESEHGISAVEAKGCVAYCGDSPNDAPMFDYFPLSVGVANIARYLPVIESPPRYTTRTDGGSGFSEFAARLLAVHNRGKLLI